MSRQQLRIRKKDILYFWLTCITSFTFQALSYAIDTSNFPVTEYLRFVYPLSGSCSGTEGVFGDTRGWSSRKEALHV